MKLFLIISTVFILSACQGNHCVKIGGSYDGVTGDLEYCWSVEKSKEAGVPVLVTPENPDLLGLTEIQIDKIVRKIKDLRPEVAAKAIHERKSPIRELLEILEEK